MDAIDERRIDLWDRKDWLTENYEPDASYDGVSVRWRDESARLRATTVGQGWGYLATVDADSRTPEEAEEVGQRFLREASRG